MQYLALGIVWSTGVALILYYFFLPHFLVLMAAIN
jgi:hypothetical protein